MFLDMFYHLKLCQFVGGWFHSSLSGTGNSTCSFIIRELIIFCNIGKNQVVIC